MRNKDKDIDCISRSDAIESIKQLFLDGHTDKASILYVLEHLPSIKK